MTKNEKLEICKNAINHFGYESQINMMIEECSELIQALCKLRRLNAFRGGLLQHPYKTESVQYCKVYWNVCSEIADVKIMLAQMEMIFNKESIDLTVERKLERLQQRINNEKA